MNQETTYSQEVDKLLNDYKELRLAAADVLMAQNEYSDKAHGFRYGGASWADWDRATAELNRANGRLHELVFKKDKP